LSKLRISRRLARFSCATEIADPQQFSEISELWVSLFWGALGAIVHREVILVSLWEYEKFPKGFCTLGGAGGSRERGSREIHWHKSRNLNFHSYRIKSQRDHLTLVDSLSFSVYSHLEYNKDVT